MTHPGWNREEEAVLLSLGLRASDFFGHSSLVIGHSQAIQPVGLRRRLVRVLHRNFCAPCADVSSSLWVAGLACVRRKRQVSK
jgi:hypothetical protein